MTDKLNQLRDYITANTKALAIGALCGLLVGCAF